MSEHLRIPAYRNKTNGAVSYGSPTHWQHPEDWEPVHVLTDDDLAQERAQALRDAADNLTAYPEVQATLNARADRIERQATP